MIGIIKSSLPDGRSHTAVEALKAAGLVAKLSVDVKILGEGELTKKLSVTAHSFSKSAAEKLEAAGGSVTPLPEPVKRKGKETINKFGGLIDTNDYTTFFRVFFGLIGGWVTVYFYRKRQRMRDKK